MKEHSYTNGTSMTVEMCHERCQSRNYSLFGVEYAKECYCGNSLASGALPAAELYECKRSFCVGDKTEFCGGGSRLLVYNIQPAGSTLPAGRTAKKRAEEMVKVKLPKLRRDEQPDYERRSGPGWNNAERGWGRGPGW